MRIVLKHWHLVLQYVDNRPPSPTPEVGADARWKVKMIKPKDNTESNTTRSAPSTEQQPDNTLLTDPEDDNHLQP